MSQGVGGISGSGTGPIQNPFGGLGVLLLSIAPQLIALIFVILTFAQWVLPTSFHYFHVPPAAFVKFSFDWYLLVIFTLPLAVIGVLTFFLIVKGPQDYYGGIALIAMALFAFYASSDLPGLKGFQFGPGTAPRLFSGLMLAMGIGVALTGLLAPGAPLERYHIRGPLLVTLAIITFAAIIRPLGLVITTFVCFMIAALGSPDQRWHVTLIVGIVITAFCCFLFPVVLGLPFQLRPRFMLN
jgi:putative tricarboxylic transport membrane protein